MSLLWMDYEAEFKNLVDTAFQCEYDANQEYFSKLDQRVKNIIYRDTRYNIDFLYTAYLLDDDKVMTDYAAWLYLLMKSVLSEHIPEQTAKYVVNHFEYIKQGIKKTISEEKQEHLLKLLDQAQKSVQNAEENLQESKEIKTFRYEAEIEQYMDSLFKKNSRRAMYLIQQFVDQGIPVSDIYVEILAESMRRVGDLWHTAKITVDTEHYCTSVTQMAMAQMYPMLFESERKNKTILCACPGTELHEMGARMVADIFENDGWDSFYLGAAVPVDAMMESIRENQPDLIALSVTMPQHLLTCRELVGTIKKEFPELKVAVGGKAFSSTHAIWEQWPIDFYTEDARQLLDKANAEICS